MSMLNLTGKFLLSRSAPGPSGLPCSEASTSSEGSTSTTLSTESQLPFEVSEELCGVDSLINSVSSSRGTPPMEILVNGVNGINSSSLAVKKEDIDGYLGEPQDNSIAG